MIQKILTLFLSVSLLTSCGSDNDSFTNEGGSNNGNNNSSTIIATPGMAKPVNPIPESSWAGDWNDKADPNYQTTWYNPLEGYWILTGVNGKTTDQFLAYNFSHGLGIEGITKKPAEGVFPPFESAELYMYQINDKQIKVRNGYIYTYSVASDRSWMTLYDGTNTYTFGVYDNNGVWYWKGDWNSKSSPYYSVYQGKYNPVKGTWKVYRDNGKGVAYTEYYRFNDDIQIEAYNPEFDQNYTRTRKYEVNDIGIKQDNWSLLGYSTMKYWIKQDTLYLQGYLSYKLVPEISKLIRIAN